MRQAITDGFAELVEPIQPPLLPHVTNPLTLERGYKGKGMPIVTFDLVDDCDYVDITCSPKALGSGRWAALEIFSFPDLHTIEKFVLDTVIKAGSQPCPPVVIGVGIGGTFDYAAKMAKEATLRPIGSAHPEPMVAAWSSACRGGQQDRASGRWAPAATAPRWPCTSTTPPAMASSPVAVAFNCWINRRTRARLYNDGRVEMVE